MAKIDFGGVVREACLAYVPEAQLGDYTIVHVGFALNVIDEVIATIRASEDRADARTRLMAEPFEFSQIQAEYILDMPLGRLTRLARIELDQELEDLHNRITELESILADDALLRGVIRDEMLAIKEEFATPRVCEITYDDGEMSIEDLVDDKELVIVMTEAQYVKAVTASSFKSQGRGGSRFVSRQYQRGIVAYSGGMPT